MNNRRSLWFVAAVFAGFSIFVASCSRHNVAEWRKGYIENHKLNELSGFATSDKYSNLLYGINDSGNNARIYRLDPDGRDLGTTKLKGVLNIDIEALSYGNCDLAEKCLFIADIGDNPRFRHHVKIHIIPEPTPDQKSVQVGRTIIFKYPDGPHDAESMFVNPKGEIFIIQKNYGKKFRDKIHKIFRIDYKPSNERKIKATATEVGALPLMADGEPVRAITDAIMAKDGTLYVRDYFRIYRANKFNADNSILALKSLNAPPMLRAEAMTLIDNDKTLVLSSEGVASQIFKQDVSKFDE